MTEKEIERDGTCLVAFVGSSIEVEKGWGNWVAQREKEEERKREERREEKREKERKREREKERKREKRKENRKEGKREERSGAETEECKAPCQTRRRVGAGSRRVLRVRSLAPRTRIHPSDEWSGVSATVE